MVATLGLTSLESMKRTPLHFCERRALDDSRATSIMRLLLAASRHGGKHETYGVAQDGL